MPKENLLFKLDGFEYQWHYLQGSQEQFQPRFNLTQRYYNAKGRKNSKKIDKVLNSLERDSLQKNLKATRVEILNRKLHNIEKHVSTYIFKTIKSFVNNDISKFQEVIQSIQEKHGSGDTGLKEFSKLITKSKIIKLVVTKLQKSSHNLINAKEEVSDKRIPKWAEDHEYVTIWKNKDHDFNPSKVWNKDVMTIKGADVMISRVMNGKKYKELIEKFEDSMDTFLNINRDKKLEKQKIQKKEKVSEEKEQSKSNESAEEGEDDEDEDDYVDSGAEDYVEFDENMDEEALLKQYDNMLGDSDSESEEEDDNSPENDTEGLPKLQKKENKTKQERAKLPELMVGYVSGGSDDEIENDKIAKEQIEIKPVKKNRRGQRARRKIWEQKYGSKAKHVQRELEKEREKRQQRQQEYEERVAKREARAEQQKEYFEKKAEEKREKEIKRKRVAETEDHPSWIAKKMEEEKRKKAKFAGKKVVFD